jgi:O-antigen/teichoic acid export membrane protein
MPPRHRQSSPASVATSTRVRDQPQLTTVTGRLWLVLGGLLGAIALAVLVPMLSLSGAGVALVGIVLVVGLYVAMLAAYRLQSGRRRLALLATGMIAIAVVSVVCVTVVAATEWDVFG